MRSPRERTLWAGLAALAIGGAVAAWWYADRWLPHAGPWAQQTWRSMTRPGPETLSRDQGGPGAAAARPGSAASTPVAQPRKCVQGDRITYTDQPCPRGSQEQPVESGAITSLPAQR
ncbi:MAG: DUF4124 domain-containing protein [Comamonadaceae bacterium]|nr:MAG: DUF4124 domain-containing protein [Comamonadaceae bacterium]